MFNVGQAVKLLCLEKRGIELIHPNGSPSLYGWGMGNNTYIFDSDGVLAVCFSPTETIKLLQEYGKAGFELLAVYDLDDS